MYMILWLPTHCCSVPVGTASYGSTPCGKPAAPSPSWLPRGITAMGCRAFSTRYSCSHCRPCCRRSCFWYRGRWRGIGIEGAFLAHTICTLCVFSVISCKWCAHIFAREYTSSHIWSELAQRGALHIGTVSRSDVAWRIWQKFNWTTEGSASFKMVSLVCFIPFQGVWVDIAKHGKASPRAHIYQALRIWRRVDDVHYCDCEHNPAHIDTRWSGEVFWLCVMILSFCGYRRVSVGGKPNVSFR